MQSCNLASKSAIMTNMLDVNKSELETLLVCSVRYALGRRSYIVSDVCRIAGSYLPHISDQTLVVISRDIQSALSTGCAGDDVDHQSWEKLLSAVLERLQKL